MLTALALLVLADVLPPPVDICRANSQCVVTAFAGCCAGCCPASPRAITRAALEREQQRCDQVKCALRPCDRSECAAVEPVSAFVAVCEAQRCVLRRPQPWECVSDSDCVLASVTPGDARCASSPCGCCPQTRAQPRSVPLPRSSPRAPPQRTWGVSPGPTCAPCPETRAELKPACVSGRCVTR